MANYHRFHWDADAPINGPLAAIDQEPDLEVSWMLGARHAKPIAEPIVCTLDTTAGTEMPDVFFFSTIPIYSDRIIAALRGAGVDNLQTYQVELVDSNAGTRRRDYKAVNVVGKVKCVDMDASSYDEESEFPMVEFESIVIDEKKVRGMKFFRLAENPGFLIASQLVADAMARDNWVGVRILDLEDFDAY